MLFAQIVISQGSGVPFISLFFYVTFFHLSFAIRVHARKRGRPYVEVINMTRECSSALSHTNKCRCNYIALVLVLQQQRVCLAYRSRSLCHVPQNSSKPPLRRKLTRLVCFSTTHPGAPSVLVYPSIHPSLFSRICQPKITLISFFTSTPFPLYPPPYLTLPYPLTYPAFLEHPFFSIGLRKARNA